MNYASVNEIMFNIGDNVWLLTKHLRTTRASNVLDYKCTGLYTVSKVINIMSCILDLAKTMQNQQVFNLAQRNRDTPPVSGQAWSESHPMLGHDTEEWDIHCNLDSQRRYWKLDYLVQDAGYRHFRMSWETEEHIRDT